MSWTFPYTVTVTPIATVVDATSGNLASNPVKGTPTSAQVDIQDMTPGQAFQSWGVELDAPAKLYCATADAAKFTNGAEVVRGSLVYTVMGEPILRDEDSDLTYCMALVNRRTI